MAHIPRLGPVLAKGSTVPTSRAEVQSLSPGLLASSLQSPCLLGPLLGASLMVIASTFSLPGWVYSDFCLTPSWLLGAEFCTLSR